MDDLKLFAESVQRLHQRLQLVTTLSNDIRMEFGIDKYRSIHLRRGQVMDASCFHVNKQEEIRNMIEGEMHKYLGFLQVRGIRHTMIKKELQEKFLSCVNCILKSFLSDSNKVKAINTFAVPLLTFSFGVVKWTKTDLKVLERAVRVVFTMHREQC